MKSLIVIRGVPGTGKSTYALKQERACYEQGSNAFTVSRDTIRMDMILCAVKTPECFIEDFNIEMEDLEQISFGMDYKKNYQISFRSQLFDNLVQRKFREVIVEYLEDPQIDDVIIDATNIKEDDLKFYSKLREKYKCAIYIHELNKEFGSVHEVPEYIMRNCRIAKEKTALLAISIADKILYVE